MQESIDVMIAADVKIIYLEELRESIGFLQKVKGILLRKVARTYYRSHNANITPNNPAVVLFTSGSEGTPKGVVLSHVNLQANRYQMSAQIDFSAQDIIFNALPIFHSFGLSAATLFPLLSGVKIFLYP